MPLRYVGVTPFVFVLAVCFFRGVEDVAPYNEWGELGIPPQRLFSSFVFMRAIQYFASLHGTLASQVCDRPYGTEQNIICRGDSRIARNVVRTFIRLRTNKRSPPTMMGEFGFAPLCFIHAVCFLRATNGRPYGVLRNFVCRGDHWSPASLFALSFGFAQTNDYPHTL